MQESFDPFEYVEYLRRRWRLIGSAGAVALVLAYGLSLLQPKRYTATASIMIEPPAGSDLRTATAVSPVYLESLRTFERFASSDTLFARAVKRFHLQAGVSSQAIDLLKRRVLKVAKLRDTKILEISATLENPDLAQKFVEYLADETVRLSRNESLASDHDALDGATERLAEANARFDKAQADWVDTAARESTAGLQSELDAASDALAKLERDLVTAEADAGAGQEREQGRVSLLRRGIAELQQLLSRKSALLSLRTARKDAVEMKVRAAETNRDAVEMHLRDLRDTAGNRGERLRVIDPGVVPERPSAPNVMLNVVSAVLFAFTLSLVYVTLAFAFRHRNAAKPSRPAERRAFSR